MRVDTKLEDLCLCITGVRSANFSARQLWGGVLQQEYTNAHTRALNGLRIFV